jgi:hypothetical protein
MSRHEGLNDEVVWDESGHLSEIAKCALADGQDAILPPAALEHFSRCHPCIESVGEAALLSAELTSVLGEARVAHRAMPWIPVGAGLVVAGVSAIPMLGGASAWLAMATLFVSHAVHLIGRALFNVAVHGFAPAFYLATTLVLVAMGFTITRLVPRTSAAMVHGKGLSS